MNFKDMMMMQKNRKTIDNTIAVTTKSNSFYLTNPELKLRHEACLPPKEAYLYCPQGTEVILFNEKKPSKSIRRIFFDMEYTQYEIDLLRRYKLLQNEYNRKHETKQIDFPEGWNDEDNLRYIYSTNCKLDKALSDMINHFAWRKATFPITISNKVIEILNLGFIYILGRDYQFRPIIVCNASVYVKHENEYTYDEWLCATLFLSQYMCSYLLIPGKVENSVMITYVQNVQLFFLPQSMKKIIGIMSDQYRSRLYLNFIVGLSQGMRFLYKIICKFLDECTVKKLVVVDQINDGKLAKQISADNLEEKFGGKVPNVKDSSSNSFFPPIMPFLPNPKALNSSADNDKDNDANKVSMSVSPLYLQKKISRQSVIQFKIDNIKEHEANLTRSRIINEIENELLKEQSAVKENDIVMKYKSSPTPLINYMKEFNNRKRMLNYSILTEGHKPSKQIMSIYDDNKTFSIDNLSTNTFHK